MPEGDTIFRAARTLHRALSGQIITSFASVLPKLTRVDFDSPLAGRTVEKVESHGKWNLMHFSGDLILLTHMLMSGSWHIYRPLEAWQLRPIHMRIVVKTERIWAVAFHVPIAEFHTAHSLRRREGFRKLGPDVLAAEFDARAAAANLRALAEFEVGPALLRQSTLAGVGNVFKSEICFACGVHPFRKVASLRDEEIACLLSTARKFLLANVTRGSGDQMVTYTGMRRTTGRSDFSERLYVYGRRGEACRNCGSAIQSYKQGLEARTTFWCPRCQPMDAGPSLHKSVSGRG
jgi:endonuclease-8